MANFVDAVIWTALCGVLLREVRHLIARVHPLDHAELCKRPWSLQGPRGDGNGDRSLAWPSFTPHPSPLYSFAVLGAAGHNRGGGERAVERLSFSFTWCVFLRSFCLPLFVSLCLGLFCYHGTGGIAPPSSRFIYPWVHMVCNVGVRIAKRLRLCPASFEECCKQSGDL